jgi:hypothetical protein
MMTNNRANSLNRATKANLLERRSRHMVFSVLTAGLILAILIAPFMSVESALAADAVGDDPCLTCPLGANASAVMAANPELMAVRRFAASREGRPMSSTFRELDLAANPELWATRRVAPSADEARTMAYAFQELAANRELLATRDVAPSAGEARTMAYAFRELAANRELLATRDVAPSADEAMAMAGALGKAPLHPDVVYGLVRQDAFNESPVGTTSPLHPDVVYGLVRQGPFNESAVGAKSPLHPDMVFGLVPPAGT